MGRVAARQCMRECLDTTYRELADRIEGVRSLEGPRRVRSSSSPSANAFVLRHDVWIARARGHPREERKVKVCSYRA